MGRRSPGLSAGGRELLSRYRVGRFSRDLSDLANLSDEAKGRDRAKSDMLATSDKFAGKSDRYPSQNLPGTKRPESNV